MNGWPTEAELKAREANTEVGKSFPAPNLVTKLNQIVAAITAVEKRGHNKEQNYKFVKSSDVAHAVRTELSSRKCALTRRLAARKSTNSKPYKKGGRGRPPL
jgi:macrodomain Ter protein organizer (MatP/YcbG family)